MLWIGGILPTMFWQLISCCGLVEYNWQSSDSKLHIVDWWINITDKVLTLLYVVDWWNNITDVIMLWRDEYYWQSSDINLFCGLTEKYQTNFGQ
jgi:hypothetical protein